MAEIALYIAPLPETFDEDMTRVWSELRHTEPALRRPFVANPPPDTLFMRPTNLDLSVFGKRVGQIELAVIDLDSIQRYGHHDTLARMLGPDLDQTVEALVSHAASAGVRCDAAEVRAGLRDGTWPTSADAMVQAAAFAHGLRDATAEAVARSACVLWTFGETTLSYRYP